MFVFDTNAAGLARRVRQLPVAVEVRCGFCGGAVRNAEGTPVMTRDRMCREGACGDPLCITFRNS